MADAHNPNKFPGQAQMRREWDDTPSSHGQSQAQNSNFLQETGGHVKTMVHGAADVGSGAAQGVISLARGAATGVADAGSGAFSLAGRAATGVASGVSNVTQGAADAIKHTFGGDNNPGSNTTTHANNINVDGMAYPSHTTTFNHSTNPSTINKP